MRTAFLSICMILVVIVLFLILGSATGWFNFRYEEAKNQRMANLRDLARNNPSDVSAIHRLISAAKSNDSVERNAAIGYLGQVGSNAAPAVSVLIEALKGPDPFDAREAATSLGEIGPAARRAIPDLIKAVQEHSSEDIGWFAAESLGAISTSNDIQVVAALVANLFISQCNQCNTISHLPVKFVFHPFTALKAWPSRSRPIQGISNLSKAF